MFIEALKTIRAVTADADDVHVKCTCVYYLYIIIILFTRLFGRVGGGRTTADETACERFRVSVKSISPRVTRSRTPTTNQPNFSVRPKTMPEGSRGDVRGVRRRARTHAIARIKKNPRRKNGKKLENAEKNK